MEARAQIKSEKLATQELRYSDYIGIVGHYDDHLLRTKDNDLIAVIKLDGLRFDTKGDDELYSIKNACAQLYSTIEPGKYGLYFHTIQSNDNAFPDGEFTQPFAKRFNDEFKEKILSSARYKAEFYLSIIRRGTKAAALDNYITKLFDKTSALTPAYMRIAQKELTELTTRLTNFLSAYEPKLLGISIKDGVSYSDPMRLINHLVNLEHRNFALVQYDFSKILPKHRLFVGDRVLKWDGINQKRYAGIIGVKSYPTSTIHGCLDHLTELKCEFILTQTFFPRVKNKLINEMRVAQTKLRGTNESSIIQADEIDDAVELMNSGEVTFGDHSFSLMLHAEDLKDLEDKMARADSILLDAGVQGVREDINLELSYWGAIPGNQKFLKRTSLIHTLNLASFNSFHSSYRGEAGGSKWGPPVTVLSNPQGNSVFFNFHKGEVGSTAIFGLTSSGKTLLTDFLLLQSLKFNPHIFFFDYLRGSEGFIRAIGGKYVEIKGGQNGDSLFNPLQMPGTAENMQDLGTWVSMLLRAYGRDLSDQDYDAIHKSVKTVFDNAPEHRTLSELAPSLPHDLQQILSSWHGEGQKAQFFGAKQDKLNFSSRIFGMDMTEVLRDDIALAPTLFYLLTRIKHTMQTTAKGEKFIIVLEEGWSLLRSPMFRDIFEQWVLTIRRLNGIIIFLTQNPEHLEKYPDISQVIVSNVQTKIYFPNYEARKDTYCNMLGLSAYEFELIKKTTRESRLFLLKMGEKSSLVKVPMEGLTRYIPLLSGDLDKAKLLDEIRGKVGDNPGDWIDTFIERAGGK
ncbi:MAG: hypothetical protein ACHQAX_05810 [Gammaproteobacteria bacterium]